MVRMLGYAGEQELIGLSMADEVYRRPEERAEALSWRTKQDSVQGR